MSRLPNLVTFITDFGLDWGPVGICHAVMRGINPQISIVDISHGIPAFDIRAGAWVLTSIFPYVPPAVHVVVVDPGVGTQRLPIAILCRRGDVLIGPDNGVLIPATRRLGGIVEARKISNKALMRPDISYTFHGRDIFCPVAAHLSSGVSFEDVGEILPISDLVQAPWREPEIDGHRVVAEVAILDKFGNIRTNIEAADWPLSTGEKIILKHKNNQVNLPVARTFGEVNRGDLLIYEDSSRFICIGQNLGHAGNTLGIGPGDTIQLERARS